MNENDVDDILKYFNMRVEQMGPNYFLSSTESVFDDGERWGIRAVIMSTSGNTYQSVFVMESARGKGLMKKHARQLVDDTGIPFITADECDIAEWFRKHRVPFLLVPLTVE